MPSDEHEQIVALLPGTPLREGRSVEEARAYMDEQGRGFPMPDGVRVEDVSIEGLRAERLIPESVHQDRALLYLHGGGYTMGSPRSHRHLAARLAVACKAPALVPDYRLAPEHPHPAALEDALAAYVSLLESGSAPARIVVGGDSAGGGLALACLLALKEKGRPLPGACFVLSPWTDLTLSGASIQERAGQDPLVFPHSLTEHKANYLGDTPETDPLVSPLLADLTGLPPLLVHVGTREILLDDATRLAAKVNQAELFVGEGLIHVWHFFAPLVPEANQAIEAIGAFVDLNTRNQED
jgi:acetyl esterase/lipase